MLCVGLQRFEIILKPNYDRLHILQILIHDLVTKPRRIK
jgi:hypothetical protein